MTIKYNISTLQKTEQIFAENNYTLRYEKGNFQSGSCVLEQQRIVVVNKFLNIENKINVLFDILLNLDIEAEKLSEESKKIFKTIHQVFTKQEQFAAELF